MLRRFSEGQVELALSLAILAEYRNVLARLESRYGDLGGGAVLELITAHAHVVDAPVLPGPISRDIDDDKFIACALGSEASVIVTGDQDILSLRSVGSTRIMTPRDFIADFEGSESE